MSKGAVWGEEFILDPAEKQLPNEAFIAACALTCVFGFVSRFCVWFVRGWVVWLVGCGGCSSSSSSHVRGPPPHSLFCSVPFCSVLFVRVVVSSVAVSTPRRCGVWFCHRHRRRRCLSSSLSEGGFVSPLSPLGPCDRTGSDPTAPRPPSHKETVWHPSQTVRHARRGVASADRRPSRGPLAADAAAPLVVVPSFHPSLPPRLAAPRRAAPRRAQVRAGVHARARRADGRALERRVPRRRGRARARQAVDRAQVGAAHVGALGARAGP